MLISIVGLSGSGKSTITKLLTSYNKHIISLDIDKISHESLTVPSIKEELLNTFGPSIINGEEVNRKVLGTIVFASPESMAKLTEITWPYMESKIDEFIHNNQDKIIILDWLLLPKTKFFIQSDYRILINASFNTRLKRAQKRDNISAEKFLLREMAAPELDESSFDYILNNEDLTETEKKVRDLYDKSIIHR